MGGSESLVDRAAAMKNNKVIGIFCISLGSECFMFHVRPIRGLYERMQWISTSNCGSPAFPGFGWQLFMGFLYFLDYCLHINFLCNGMSIKRIQLEV